MPHIHHMSGSNRQLGALLRNLRELRGLTQQELATIAGLSMGTLHRAEKGTKPYPQNLFAIIKALSDRVPLSPDDAAALAKAADIDPVALAPYIAPDPAAIEGSRRQCEALLAELLRGSDPKPIAHMLHAMLAFKSSIPQARRVSSPPPDASINAETVRMITEGPHPDIPGAWQVLYEYFLKDGRRLLPKADADKRARSIADEVMASLRAGRPS